MTDPISRRDFLKIAGLGGASAVLAGSGAAARCVLCQPLAGISAQRESGSKDRIATTCGECPAGCGLIFIMKEGRPARIEGNPAHPVSVGGMCSRGQASLNGLHGPGRIPGPGHQPVPGSGRFDPIAWDRAVEVVKNSLQDGAVFLLGPSPGYLHDLAQVIADALSRSSVLRYSTLDELDGRVTLMDACQKLFGASSLPIFDIARSEVIFSFGADFTEAWLSPVAYTRAYEEMRRGYGGCLVQFEPRKSKTAAHADEWVPIAPGSEGLVAGALGRLVSELAGKSVFADIDIAAAASASGISEDDLLRLARIFAGASRKVALPGGTALGHTHGLSSAESILALNALAGSLGKEGGLFLSPASPLHPGRVHRPSTLAEMAALIERMKAGKVQTLFIHRCNPAGELPAALGFAEALGKVPQVISFSPALDETTLLAGYVLPDHTPLESWGYQHAAGGDRLAISAFQPAVLPQYDTRSTAGVLLAAARAAGGRLAGAVDFTDEVDFIKQSAAVLFGQGGVPAEGGSQALELFWDRWQQTGGWWPAAPGLDAPDSSLGIAAGPLGSPSFSGEPAEYPLHLLLFPHFGLAGDPVPIPPEAGATWVEIHPKTRRALGIGNGDLVRILSPSGELQALVCERDAIRPDVIAMPVELGDAALRHGAAGRGVSPLALLAPLQNESGSLAFMATRVKVLPASQSISSING